MVLKTFNLNEETYRKFSEYCKEHGISMSKQVNIFIDMQLEEDPKVRASYLKRLDRIKKRNKFVKVDNFSERYGL